MPASSMQSRGSIRDVVYFVGAGPTRTCLAKTNFFVAHSIHRRRDAATHRGRRTTYKVLRCQITPVPITVEPRQNIASVICSHINSSSWLRLRVRAVQRSLHVTYYLCDTRSRRWRRYTLQCRKFLQPLLSSRPASSLAILKFQRLPPRRPRHSY
ncbi:hypothetical protein EDB84DRAFT_561083 [Lactarius hengduanensis]|nr:hypothetical protein EDB84DRAFT_561083 [Lactarius hengduanensis]